VEEVVVVVVVKVVVVREVERRRLAQADERRNVWENKAARGGVAV
jgi:hypothetical protein